MQKSKIEHFYLKYEYLATIYANKVFNFERASLERQDIEQEMRIKIYKSILGYARQWQEYRETGLRKPVPMEIWIRSTLSRKLIDFIKLFNYDRVENQNKLSFDNEDGVDIGFNDTSSLIFESISVVEKKLVKKGVEIKFYETIVDDVDSLKCELNGVNLIDGLVGDRKKCYSMYCYGAKIGELTDAFPEIDVPFFIENWNRRLRSKHKDELLDYENKMFKVRNYDED
jgi:hypothetical protein